MPLHKENGIGKFLNFTHKPRRINGHDDDGP